MYTLFPLVYLLQSSTRHRCLCTLSNSVSTSHFLFSSLPSHYTLFIVLTVGITFHLTEFSVRFLIWDPIRVAIPSCYHTAPVLVEAVVAIHWLMFCCCFRCAFFLLLLLLNKKSIIIISIKSYCLPSAHSLSNIGCCKSIFSATTLTSMTMTTSWFRFVSSI